MSSSEDSVSLSYYEYSSDEASADSSCLSDSASVLTESTWKVSLDETDSQDESFEYFEHETGSKSPSSKRGGRSEEGDDERGISLDEIVSSHLDRHCSERLERKFLERLKVSLSVDQLRAACYEYANVDKIRTDYELELNKSCAQFEGEEVKKEVDTCQILTEIVRRGEVGVGGLWNSYKEHYKDDTLSLNDFSTLEAFLSTHSHVFEVTQEKTVKSRSFRYSKFFPSIVHLVFSKGGEARIRDIFNRVRFLPACHSGEGVALGRGTAEKTGKLKNQFFWTTEPTTTKELLEFFEEHEGIFRISSPGEGERDRLDTVITLTPASLTIPSLWNSTILDPTHFSTKNLTKDYSNQFLCYGNVVSVTESRLNIFILSGQFKGLVAGAYRTELDCSSEIWRQFKIGQEVATVCSPVYNGNQNFFVRTMKLVESEGHTWRMDKKIHKKKCEK